MMGAIAVPIRAQEAAQPTVDLATKAKEPKAVAEAAAPKPAPSPELPDLPELSQLDEAFKQTSLGTKADQFRMHAEWRRLRNRVANDPEIVAAKKAADGARTDFEKRERLRRYYNLYYARMAALTDRADIKAGLENMKEQHLGLADQNRVRPSPSPSATSSPVSSPVAPAPPAEGERPLPLTSTSLSETATPTPAAPSPAESSEP
jgi:hypothetical protein